MDQSLIAGDDTISPALNSGDITQFYHNYFLSSLQFPYIPSYNFPNINIADYCNSLTNNQTFKIPKPETTSFHFSQLPGLDEKPKRTQKSNRVLEKGRIRRKKISDKTKSLQKLLPTSNKKMEIATVYDEASKYIKYLKAQIKVLEAMSVDGSCSGSNFGCENDGYGNGNDSSESGYGFKELEKLKRSELLEVLVNSEVGQGIMYSRGFCVYSIEQKLLIKELDDQHLLSVDPSSFYF